MLDKVHRKDNYMDVVTTKCLHRNTMPRRYRAGVFLYVPLLKVTA